MGKVMEHTWKRPKAKERQRKSLPGSGEAQKVPRIKIGSTD